MINIADIVGEIRRKGDWNETHEVVCACVVGP